MKYILIVCMLFASCSIFRKTVNQQKQESSKSTFSQKDSVGKLSVDVNHVSGVTILSGSTIDSAYDKVTDEVVIGYTDSIVIRRTIKEKGQKRTEQSSQVVKYDSGAALITEHSQLQELLQEDSADTVVTVQKDVKCSSFLPWWLWIIVAGIAGLTWWKRNSIIEFFT